MTDGDAAAPEQSTDAGLQCHFCKKAQQDVELLVAGPSELICDECIDLCAEILMEHRGFQPCPHTVRSHPEYRAMFDNLTSTQERCSELLQDARTLGHALGPHATRWLSAGTATTETETPFELP